MAMIIAGAQLLSLSKTTTLKYRTEQMGVDDSSLRVDSQTKWVRLV